MTMSFCFTSAIENANDRNVDELQPKNTEISVFDKILELPRFFFGKREGKLPTEQSWSWNQSVKFIVDKLGTLCLANDMYRSALK